MDEKTLEIRSYSWHQALHVQDVSRAPTKKASPKPELVGSMKEKIAFWRSKGWIKD